jgi:hypothetical protein
MVALDLRAVVRVDRGAALAVPGTPVTHGQVRGADPRPVDLQRLAVITGQAPLLCPGPDGVTVNRPGEDD